MSQKMHSRRGNAFALKHLSMHEMIMRLKRMRESLDLERKKLLMRARRRDATSMRRASSANGTLKTKR